MSVSNNAAHKAAHRIAKHMMSGEGTAAAWGTVYEDGGVGWARVSFIVKSEMLNGFDTIHGGIIFGLADSAFAYACNSYNNRAVAQQASIAFLSPAYAGEKLTAIAKEEAIAGRSGIYNVKVTGPDDRVIATFQGLSRTIRGHVLEEE